MGLTEDLEAAVHAGDAARSEKLLAGLSEGERKGAAGRMLELLREYYRFLEVAPGVHSRRIPQSNAATVAVLGTASLAVLKKTVMASTYPVHGVLAERKPEWLAEWAEATFERGGQPFFRDIRRLIRDGVLAKPRSEGYIRAFIGSLMEPLENLVAREPDLLEYEIWRLFEVEGDAQASLAGHDKYVGDWAKGLAGLAEKGLAPRARLLDASLDALERDFAPFRAAWFSAFHESLTPSKEERAARAGRYLALLGSRVSTTVSFAMKAVAKIEKAGLLDTAAALPLLGAGMAARQKGVVMEALQVLDSIRKRKPALAEATSGIAALALVHESPEVQKRAVDLMEACVGGAAPLVAQSFQQLLAPTQRARLGLERPGLKMEQRPVSEAALEEKPERVNAVRDLDELVELYASVMENAGPPVEMERVLDGVSRMCGERDSRFAPLTAPLAARAEKFLATPSMWAVAGWFDGRWDPRFSLAALALAWIRKEPVKLSRACHGVCSFLTGRVAEVAVRALNGQAKPLAALPCGAEGWIPPLEFVERLHKHPEPERLDLIQGLLRLSMADRVEALEQARSLPGPEGRIVRFALGSEDCRRPPRFFDEALWLAAGQARDPEGGAGVHRLRWHVELHRISGSTYRIAQVAMDSWPPPEFDAAKAAALTAIPGTHDAAMLRWCSTVWPAHREPWFAAGALALAQNIDWQSAMWGNRVYVETLAAYRGVYGPMAYELLALGLAAKETGEAMAATDALVAGLGDGRVKGARLGEVCAKLAGEGTMTVSRWVKRFAAVARLYPGYCGELFTAMERMLAGGAPVALRELSGFLELLCELRGATGEQIGEKARAHLGSMKLSGKAMKFAKTLLG
ncbi:MAG: hypothetical protein JNK48_00315 [Bryobacterales bacterium]|nr:hypothetical protein [Bryobacterales bacterium]